jgi:hypothetical protein
MDKSMQKTVSPPIQSESAGKSLRAPVSLLKGNTIFLPLLIVSALLGMAFVVYATNYGPGVGGDATIYLVSAENITAGIGPGWLDADGSFRLLPYSPPFYPLLLSFFGLFGFPLVDAARWLNVILFAATIVVLGWTIFRATRQPWLAGIISGLAAASPVFVNVHLWAMTEPLFLFLGFASLFLLWEHLERPRSSVLVGAGVLAGLAFLTRHIGVTFVLTGSLALLILRQAGSSNAGPVRVPFLRRFSILREPLLFGIISVMPMFVWLAFDFFFTGTIGSRSSQPVEAYWQRFLEMGPALQKIFLFWLLPESVIDRLPANVRSALWLVPLLALISLSALLLRKRFAAQKEPSAFDANPGSRSAARLAIVYGLFIVLYLIVLAAVQVFTYPPVTLASRMLSPVHLPVLLLLFLLFHLARGRFIPGSSLAFVLIYFGGVLVFGSYTLRSALIVRDYHQTGIGYNAAEWRSSKTVAMLDTLPLGVPIISNEVTAIMFFAGRPAYALQEIYQDQPTAVFRAYGAGDDESQRVFREQGGALVLFYNTLYDDFALYGDQVEARLANLTEGLFPYFEGEDGAIYFQSEPAFKAVP